MGVPFHHQEQNFTLTIDKPSNSFVPSNYCEATLKLLGLEGDSAFFILVAQHPCVEAISLQPKKSKRECTFLVSATLGSDPEYTLEHFSEQIGYLVSQLKERVDWRRSSRDNFLLQPTVGHSKTVYVTVKPRKGQGKQEILGILKSITTVTSVHPNYIGDETFVVLMPPYNKPLEVVEQMLRESF